MEYRIGDRITLEVAEREDRWDCKGCFFYCPDYEYTCSSPLAFLKCFDLIRTDHKNIIYKEIKEE